MDYLYQRTEFFCKTVLIQIKPGHNMPVGGIHMDIAYDHKADPSCCADPEIFQAARCRHSPFTIPIHHRRHYHPVFKLQSSDHGWGIQFLHVFSLSLSSWNHTVTVQDVLSHEGCSMHRLPSLSCTGTDNVHVPYGKYCDHSMNKHHFRPWQIQPEPLKMYPKISSALLRR